VLLLDVVGAVVSGLSVKLEAIVSTRGFQVKTSKLVKVGMYKMIPMAIKSMGQPLKCMKN